MKIVLIDKLGDPKSLAISPLGAKSVGLLFVVFCTGIFFSGASMVKRDFVDSDVIRSWRPQLAEQKGLVAELQRTPDAQSQAAGRQLAAMQGRLWRTEALASYNNRTLVLPPANSSFD